MRNHSAPVAGIERSHTQYAARHTALLAAIAAKQHESAAERAITADVRTRTLVLQKEEVRTASKRDEAQLRCAAQA